jgi:hypothetical protein
MTGRPIVAGRRIRRRRASTSRPVKSAPIGSGWSVRIGAEVAADSARGTGPEADA